MKKTFHDLLHAYKVEAFKVSHSAEQVEEITKEIHQSIEEALNNAYRFHFDEDPDTRTIEIFNMIKNFTQQAILPPVVDKVMRRVVVLERQQQLMVKLFDDLLEALSKDLENNSASSAG